MDIAIDTRPRHRRHVAGGLLVAALLAGVASYLVAVEVDGSVPVARQTTSATPVPPIEDDPLYIRFGQQSQELDLSTEPLYIRFGDPQHRGTTPSRG